MAAGLLLGAAITTGLVSHNAEATRSEPDVLDAAIPAIPAMSSTADHAAEEENPGVETAVAPEAVEEEWQTITVQSGDNLSLIFNRHGLSARELHQIMSLGEETQALKKIFPGKEIRYRTDDDGSLLALAYDTSEARTLKIQRMEHGFVAEPIEHELVRQVARASVTIHDSLFMSASRAGLSDNLTMELAGIFGWDIDFALDIRRDDRFSIIYEELFLHGEKLRDGRILAAKFVNRGKKFHAVYYTDAEGRSEYYTPEGNSLRKAFLRSPVAFTRVSSRFNMQRRHPILNTIRAHRGVDYAAPTGTPVKSTGDGRIVSIGTNGGYGKTIVVQHGSRYSTLYAHLSGYAQGLRSGQTVRQGQVIGYVGMTGMATGPHLHYEFQVDGSHRNPLTVALPDASPLSPKYMADFNEHAAPLLAQFKAIDRMHAALARDGSQHRDANPFALNTMQ